MQVERFKIRKCQMEDLPQVVELSRQWAAKDSTLGYHLAQWTLERSESRIGDYFWVAVDQEQRVMGYTLGEVKVSYLHLFPRESNYFELHEVYVERAARGGGIGHAMVDRILSVAREQGIHQAVVASSNRDWARIIPFYEAHDFRVWYVQMARGSLEPNLKVSDPVYPNYRLTVEIILVHQGRFLLTRRKYPDGMLSDVWGFPAGKVKYEETPLQALDREAQEELNLRVELIKELEVRTGRLTINGSAAYRLFTSYLVRPENDDISSLCLNEEHRDYRWMALEDLASASNGYEHENVERMVDLASLVLSQRS
ncbi:MAG: GNAT family N-acetyltransferase [Sulfobacillus sp.]